MTLPDLHILLTHAISAGGVRLSADDCRTLARAIAPPDLRERLARFRLTPRLTPRQMQLAEWVEAFIREHDFAPTMQEMADGLGVSKVTIFECVHAMEKRGALSVRKHCSRSLRFAPGVLE